MNTHVRLLPVIAAVALGAFALRAISIAEAAGEASAENETTSETTPPDNSYADYDDAGDDYNAPQPVTAEGDASCPAPDLLAEQAGLSQYEIQVLRNLADRRDELEVREESLDTRELTISAAELRLNDQIDELKKLEGQIQGLLVQLDDKNEAQILSLVKVYESMKAKDAARIFNTLDDGLMLSIADRMKPANMAAVLAGMAPDRARTLTQLMAQKTEPPETLQDLEARTNAP